jgi:hypothetical protein
MDSTCAHRAPFVFPFPSFNKPHLHPRVLLGFFHSGTQEPRSSENTSAVNMLRGLPNHPLKAAPPLPSHLPLSRQSVHFSYNTPLYNDFK